MDAELSAQGPSRSQSQLSNQATCLTSLPSLVTDKLLLPIAKTFRWGRVVLR